MESKFKRAFTRTTAVLFAALLLATSAYVPQVEQVVPTGIVASAADVTVVTTENDLKTAFAVGGDVKLGADISITSNDIENSMGEVTLDLNGHKIEFGPSTCFIVHQTLTITDSSDDHTGTVMQSNNRVLFKLQTDSSLDIKGGNYIVTTGNYSGTANLASGLEGSTVSISGGSFNVNDIVAEPVTASVSGGTFTKDVSKYVSDGAKQIQDGNSFVVLKFQYTDGTNCWGLTEDGTLYLFGKVILSDEGYYGWRSYLTSIKKVVALTSARAGGSFQNAFADCSSLKEADLSKLTISNTTNLSYLFCNCSKLTKVTMSNNTANVTNMTAMFYGCSSLQTVDVSKWKTDNVTNMEGMFYGCSSLQTVDVSKWKTDNVTCMNYMFSNCSSLQTVDVSKWNTGKVESLEKMFNYCSGLTSLDISSWDMSNVSKVGAMFDNCNKLSSLTVGEKVSIPADANLPNKYNSNTGLVDGWYDADGELVSGEGNYAVISKQSGTLRRATKDFAYVTVSTIEDQLYTGEAITPKVTVKDGDTEMTEDVDYKLTYSNNDKVGTATVTVRGIGNYAGSIKTEFEIIGSDISNATIGGLEDVIYTGEAFTPAVTVTLNGNTLTKDTDYTVEYTDNIDAGTATVTVTGTGIYTGTVKKTFKILNLFDVSGLDNAFDVKVYDADENEVAASAGKYVVEPGYTITSKAALTFEGVKTTKYDPDETGNPYAGNYTYEVTKLTANIGKASHKHDARVSTDYRLLVECDTEAGTSLETLAELTVHGDGTYKYGEKIEITQDNLGKNEAYKTAAEKYGNKGPVEFIGKPAFQENTPNNEDWDGNVRTDIGSYRVNTGAKFLNSTYYLFKNYEITAKNVAELTAMIDLDGEGTAYSEVESAQLPTITYDGKTYTPTAKLVYKDFWDGTDTLTNKTLELDKDYTVEINEGKTAGTYEITFTGIGNFTGTKTVEWTIQQADIYSIKVAGGSKTYDGKPVTEKDFRITTKLTETSAKDPNADIKYNFVFKKNGEVVTDPKDAGTYTVEVTAYDEKGNYQSKTVGTDGDIIFTIAKRKVELYPTEGQSAEYGTDVAGLNIAYTTEVADEESITGLLPTDTVDFSSALTVEFGEDTPIPVGFYPIKINEAIDFGNYQAVKGEDVEFEITKATLKDNWFAVYLDEDPYVDHTFDGKNIKVKVVDVNGSLEQNKDFTATGDFEAYLPGTYTITVKGKGNYQGKVTKTWKIDANKTVTASTTVATEESSDVHVYDGEAPAVNVVPNDAENPLPEFTDVTYDYYVKDTATGEWTKLTAAPTDAGSYKVQGNAASKGYEIEVSAKEYTIAKKPIQITIDPKDLTGTYGQETFTIPYTVAEDAIIEKDKANGVAVSGNIVVNAAGKDTGVLDIDFSGVTVNSTNYELVFPENTTFTLAPKQLKDENIVFENASADLHDIGTTRITYKVVVNGKELVEGTDYEASGTTEADEAGSYKVQIVGKGNYAGFAEAAWTLAYNEEARNAALEAIAENVTASFKSDDNGIAATAAFTGGKRKVTATAVAALKDGLEEGDKYTVTRTGMVYYNGDMEGFDAATLTVDNADGVTMFDAGRNNLKEYKYGMIDVNKGIVAKAYAVVNDGSYETVVYSDAVTLNYDELIRYNVKVNGGTILATGEKEAQYSGTDIQQNKPFVRVTVDAAEIPEDQQFLCWTKNGVVASYAETFSFYMSEKDTVVTALYADKDEEIEKLAASYMDSITLLPDENKFKCVTMSSVPSDCTILKSGLIFTSDTITDPDDFTSEKYASTVRGNATTAHNYRYTWTKSNVGDGTYYVRSYVKYTDANGVEKETYGDVYKISMNGYEML